MSFSHIFIYLLAAVTSVPLANRLGLGSVLGSLLPGVVIGPFGLRFVGGEGDDLMHVAEFGDAEQVETLGRFGIKSYCGDATRLDLLRIAGAERAKLFVIAIDNEDQELQTVELLPKNFPQLRILARATSRQHAYELLRGGVHDVYRETFGSAGDLSVDALQALGLPQQRAMRTAQIFREHDEASVREMAHVGSDDRTHTSRWRGCILRTSRTRWRPTASSKPKWPRTMPWRVEPAPRLCSRPDTA